MAGAISAVPADIDPMYSKAVRYVNYGFYSCFIPYS